MTQVKAIRSLIEKIEAGGATKYDCNRFDTEGQIFRAGMIVTDPSGHFESFAFALMREVLGDRWYTLKIGQEKLHGEWACVQRSSTSFTAVSGVHTSLPTAILIAVIKALIFEKENG